MPAGPVAQHLLDPSSMSFVIVTLHGSTAWYSSLFTDVICTAAHIVNMGESALVASIFLHAVCCMCMVANNFKFGASPGWVTDFWKPSLAVVGRSKQRKNIHFNCYTSTLSCVIVIVTVRATGKLVSPSPATGVPSIAQTGPWAS